MTALLSLKLCRTLKPVAHAGTANRLSVKITRVAFNPMEGALLPINLSSSEN